MWLGNHTKSKNQKLPTGISFGSCRCLKISATDIATEFFLSFIEAKEYYLEGQVKRYWSSLQEILEAMKLCNLYMIRD